MGDWGEIVDEDADTQMEAAIRASLVETANTSVNVPLAPNQNQSNIPNRQPSNIINRQINNSSNVNIAPVRNEMHECPICQQNFNSVLQLEEHVNICSMAFD